MWVALMQVVLCVDYINVCGIVCGLELCMWYCVWVTVMHVVLCVGYINAV